MTSTHLLQAAQALPLFSGISEMDTQALLKQGAPHSYAAGKRLFTQGDDIGRCVLLVSGTVQLVRTTPNGDEKTIDLARAGQMLGITEILDSCSTYRVSAVALEPVECVEFPVRWVTANVSKYPAFALNLLTSIAHRMHLAELEAEQQATMSSTQLVACFIQRLCVMYNADPGNFTLPYAKSVIASRLGIEPETFSRTLKELRSHGLNVQGNQVTITPDLDQYVCDACSVMDHCDTRHAIQGKFSNT